MMQKAKELQANLAKEHELRSKVCVWLSKLSVLNVPSQDMDELCATAPFEQRSSDAPL